MTPHLPSLTARQLIAILIKYGFALDRQSGSHAIYIHPDGRCTTVPVHGKRNLGRGLLRQIMKDAGLDTDDLTGQ